MPREITSDEWRSHPHLTDYRVERLSDMLVERATWGADVATELVETVIAKQDYIWFRFWLFEADQIVEKYFDEHGAPIGIYAPVGLPFRHEDHRYLASTLDLALWIVNDGQVLVLHEPEFDAAVASGAITDQDAEKAELRIRELTLATAKQLFPPAIIRNFALDLIDPTTHDQPAP